MYCFVRFLETGKLFEKRECVENYFDIETAFTYFDNVQIINFLAAVTLAEISWKPLANKQCLASISGTIQ